MLTRKKIEKWIFTILMGLYQKKNIDSVDDESLALLAVTGDLGISPAWSCQRTKQMDSTAYFGVHPS